MTLTRWVSGVRAGPFRFGERLGRRSAFSDFILRRNPNLLHYEHIPRLATAAQKVVDGDIRRLLVMLPPRYFKTEVFTRLLTSYFLRKHPKKTVGIAGHDAALAWEFSEEARNYFASDGGIVLRQSSAKSRWRTRERGGVWARGVGAGTIGLGFHLGICDDPIDPERAHSPAYQKRFERWWSGKFLSRQEPSAAIVFVMQRLNPLDPVDYLFRREVGEDTDVAPENWHVICCDEIKSDEKLGRWNGPMGLPPTCTLENDPRTKGEVLAPSRFAPDEVKRLQASAGQYVRNAQRQQRPDALTGDFWKEGWFQTYEELPADAFNGGKDWDTAFTDKEANAASAYVETFRGPGEADRFTIYVNDVGWEWLESPELVYWMGGPKPPQSKTAEFLTPVPGPHYVEDKASGKPAAQNLRQWKIAVNLVSVKGTKLERASWAQPVVANLRVKVRRSVLRKLLHGDRQGLLRVTSEGLASESGDLDVNDAFVQAILRHAKPPRRQSLPIPLRGVRPIG